MTVKATIQRSAAKNITTRDRVLCQVNGPQRPKQEGAIQTQSKTFAEAQNSNRDGWVQIVQASSRAVAVIETEKTLGSGFFVNANGILVTNHHVIAGAKSITVWLNNGEAFRRAYLLATDERRDLAILRIEATNVSIVELGSSNDVQPNEEVLLIGAPRGLEQTVSTGIVSGIRILEEGNKQIQTTAPASPGSSGGPLLNRDGKVTRSFNVLCNRRTEPEFCNPYQLRQRNAGCSTFVARFSAVCTRFDEIKFEIRSKFES